MLNVKQRKVAFELTGNTIVSASPGTGKTKTLVARAVKKLESLPKFKSLALITYTNTAADEIASRINSEGHNIFIGTIHRFCLEFILRPFGWIYNWSKPRIITYEELKLFLELYPDIYLGNSPLDELGKIKHDIKGNLDFSIDWQNKKALTYVAELYFNYVESLHSIDFNEILYRSYKIVTENTFVAESLASKFYEISIDEFQDTNIFQYEIFNAINKIASCSFFIVGDEKQRIYKFAGAIDGAFEKATSDFKASVENLNITYRSTSNIIRCYSSLFPLHPVLENQSQYKDVNYKIIISETKNSDNIQYIDNCLSKLIEEMKVPLSEIAILTNSWWDAFPLSKSLRQKYHIVGLGALPHKNINSSTLALIRCLSRFAFAPNIRNLRVIKRNIEFHALEKSLILSEKQIIYITNALVSKIKDLDLSVSLYEGLFRLRDYFESVFEIKHSDFEEIFFNISQDEAALWTIGKYFKTLAGLDGITVNTIHQSKGLEFEVVFVCGVNENKIPHQPLLDRTNWVYGPLTDESIEDGRTKLYVGMSRAKRILILIHNWKPSMFISTIRASNNLTT